MIAKTYQNNPSSVNKDILRILLVDDEKLVSQVLTTVLESEPDLEIVKYVDNAHAALEEISIFHPDIVLVDIEMPGIDGLTLTSMIAEEFPEIKVVIYSSHDRKEYIRKAMMSGAKGYLLKDNPFDELADAIRFVNKGYFQFGKGLFKKIASQPSNSGSDSQDIDMPVTNISASSSEKDLLVLQEEKESSANNSLVSQATNELSEYDVEDWSPATKDLLDALPRVWTRGLAYVLIVFAGVLIPWVSMSRIDKTGTARGRLEPKDKTIVLDAPVVGKVTSVQVKEGDTVKTGQILAELESDFILNQLDELQEKQSGQQNRLVQMELIKNQLTLSLRTQEQQNEAQQLEKKSQIEQSQQNLNSLQSLYNVEKEEVLAKVDQVKQTIESSRANYRLAKIALAGVEEKIPRYQQAFKDGIIPLDRLQDIEQEAKENQERLLQSESQVQQARSQLKEQQRSYQRIIQEKELGIEQAELILQEQQRSYQSLVHSGKLALLKNQEQIKEIETQITTLKAEIAQTNSQIASLRLQLKQRIVKAPANGIVFHLPVSGVGDVVNPGDTIIEIAPENSTLILKALMSPKESGSLKVEMPVKMKFDAYPFQDYGIVKGRLIWISPNSKYLESAQGRQEVFELKIELDQPYIENQKQRIILTPGQTATAEVIVEQRRIISLILDPFKKLKTGGLEL